MNNVKQQTVIITGGGRGIGGAVVDIFAKHGGRVIFTYRKDKTAAEKRATELCRAGHDVRATFCDQSIPENVERFFATLDDAGIIPDVVINNAGITGPKRRLDETSNETLNAVMMTNVVGVAVFCREAARRMSTRHGGRGGVIVNISSTATRLGSPGQWVDYAAGKGAIDILTKGLAHEVGGEGIRVNAVAPGLILNDPDKTDEIMARFEGMKHEIPIDRVGTADDIAAAVYWLCTDQASYITGAIIPVSGGR